MLDLPDMDAALPLMPFPAALVQPWSVSAQPFMAAELDGLLSTTQPTPSGSMRSWLSYSVAQQPDLAVVLGPTLDPAVVTPLSLGTLLEPVMLFAQSEAPTEVVEHAAVAVVPQLPDDPGLENWVAISEVRVVAASEDILSPTLAGLAACTVSAAPPTDPAQADKLRYQVWLQDHHIVDVESADQAEAIAQQLRKWHQAGLIGEAVMPLLDGGRPLIKIDDDTVMPVTAAMAESLGHDPEWVAVAIANNLRRASGVAELDASAVQMAFDQLATADQTWQGIASWYGPYFHGRITATGETFNQYDLTAAHKTLAFGTRLKVRNLHNGRTVIVRINDRGPYIGDRSLDLSKAAAQCLGGEHAGLMTYEAFILQDEDTLVVAQGDMASSPLDQN